MIHQYVKDKAVPRRQMLLAIHKLLDDADIVVHYNGTKFDIPVLNKEFFKHRITPPSPYKEVDLYKAVRRRFRFESNKMTAVAKQLGLAEKLNHEGFQMWVKCMEGQAEAWKKMSSYNKHDVVMLSELYTLLVPWIPNHPKMNIDIVDGCPKCGVKDQLQARGRQITTTMTYRRYQCQACGGWCRERIAEQGSRPQYV